MNHNRALIFQHLRSDSIIVCILYRFHAYLIDSMKCNTNSCPGQYNKYYTYQYVHLFASATILHSAFKQLAPCVLPSEQQGSASFAFMRRHLHIAQHLLVLRMRFADVLQANHQHVVCLCMQSIMKFSTQSKAISSLPRPCNKQHHARSLAYTSMLLLTFCNIRVFTCVKFKIKQNP